MDWNKITGYSIGAVAAPFVIAGNLLGAFLGPAAFCLHVWAGIVCINCHGVLAGLAWAVLPIVGECHVCALCGWSLHAPFVVATIGLVAAAVCSALLFWLPPLIIGLIAYLREFGGRR